MPFFEVKKPTYPGARTTAENLSKRFSSELLEAVVTVMQQWIIDDLKPGRQEVELVGSAANGEMVRDVMSSMFSGASVMLGNPLQITRCWVAVRKCGYKQMRDGRFQLFVDEVQQAIVRRQFSTNGNV